MERSRAMSRRELVLRGGALASAGLAAPPAGARQARQAAVEFDAQGRLLSLRCARSGRELLAAPGSGSVFALEIERGGRSFWLSARDAGQVTVERSPGRTVVRYRNLGDTGIEATCTVRTVPGEPLPLWRLTADLPRDCTLAMAGFPVVDLSPLSEGRDAWVSGATKGGLHPRPSAWEPGRRLDAAQPGSLAAAFACYYDARGGVTTQARDTRGFQKAVAIERTRDAVSVHWLQSCRGVGRWDLGYDVALGAFGGAGRQPADWRDAADLYKRWALRQPWCRRTLARRTDLPAWLRQGPAMVRFHRGWLADIPSIDRWMGAYWRRRYGAVPLIVAYWGWEKVEAWVTPDYFPVFPSDAAFRSLAARNRRAGGRTFLWPSGYHYTLTFGRRPDGSFRWDDRARFEAVARPHAVVGRDGQPLVGDRFWLEGGQTAALCPGDPWTRRWLDAIGEACAERGAEIVQVDQVVGGAFPVCWSASHGHPPGPGGWMTDVFRLQLESLLAACRKRQPGAVVCFEEPNELFIQQVGLQDYRDWEVFGQGDTEPASVFNYLYHEFLPTFQSNPRPRDLLQAAWCLVTGQMPHLVPDRRIGPGPAVENGDFEAWVGDVPLGWDRVGGWQGEVWTGECARDAEVRRRGAASLRLRNVEPGQTVQVSQNVAVGGGLRVGGRHRLRLWLKSGGASPGASLMFGAFAEGLRPTWSGGIPVPAEPGDWQEAEVSFTVPPSSVLLRIMLHLAGPGTAWVDDLRLETLGPDGTWSETARSVVPEDHAFMRAWVDLYHGIGRPYLQMGRTLRPPRLECAEVTDGAWRRPAVLHNAYEAPDGSRAVVVVNATSAPQRCRVWWRGAFVALDLAPWRVRLLRGATQRGPSPSAGRGASGRHEACPYARWA